MDGWMRRWGVRGGWTTVDEWASWEDGCVYDG